MTKISYIHGPVPVDEIQDRAAEVKPAPYFNPLEMTEGEAHLRLMLDQAQILAEYYPESKLYKKAVAMAANALHSGIHGAHPFIGSVDPALYPVARAIDIYKAQRQPATRPVFGPSVGSWTNESLVAGVIPEVSSEFALWWIQQDKQWLTDKVFKGKSPSVYALKGFIAAMKGNAPVSNDFKKRYAEFFGKYETIRYIIDLYNGTIEKFAHHPLYNFLPQRNEYPGSVITKNILHAAGVQACANTGEFSISNMALWLRNGILRANIGGNVGAISPERTAFILSELPDEMYSEFLGISPNNTSSKKWKINGSGNIGNPLLLALIPLLTAAVGAAAQMYTAAQQRKAAAFAGVQGWGTDAYSATSADWKGWKIEPGQFSSNSQTNWPLIIGAGALGAWFLTKK